MKIFISIFFVVFLISCGGGGGSSNCQLTGSGNGGGAGGGAAGQNSFLQNYGAGAPGINGKNQLGRGGNSGIVFILEM